ncbi:MAG TPA: beta-ketoacyl-[acyl-carrier-protein] synthase family protein [Micromonosporaceae bacterium]
MDRKEPSPERVAITGVAISCALGDGTEQVWKAIRDAQSGISLTKRLDVSTLSCKYSGEMGDVATPSRTARQGEPWRRPRGRLDRATRLVLNAAREVFAASELPVTAYDPYRVGVALGTSVGGLDEGERFHWELLEGGVEATRRDRLLIYPLYTSADALSVAYGLKGPKVVISNACAAGGNSIGYASDLIRWGRADAMLAGGVDVLDILSMAGFDSLKALDPEPCAPYSRSTGLNIGEGAALLVLEAESAALRREAPILGYIRGYAMTSDAHHATAPDPAGNGALRAMRRALARSGLQPSDVDYVNGHGTGTPANDGAEPKAIDALFQGATPPPMSSTKSQIGHTLGAAGAIEAAVSVMALRDGLLPPTINVADPSALTRDIVPNASRPATVDTVVSNSFAFGGNNCALVLGGRPREVVEPADHRVVITGAGVVSPLGVGRQELLEALRTGQVAIGQAATTDTGLSSTHLAAEVAEAAMRRHIDRAYVRRLDQLGRLVLAATRLALKDAAYPLSRDTSDRIGMIFGTFTGPLETVGQLTETIGTLGPHRVNPKLFPNSVMNAAAGHACLSLQLRGPLSTLATGCSSGLTGLGYAADLVRRGEADAMLAVSADELTPLLHLGFDRLGMLADQSVHPYDTDPSGMAIGAGGAALVVETLESAKARGATILAEVAGHSITSDAYRVAGNEPSGEAWAESFLRAIADAGLTPADVGTVYGDARGTAALDRAEARAVAKVWQPGQVRLANLNSQTGHLHSTTALLAAVAATETVSSGWAPELLGLRNPLPEIADHLKAAPSDTRACLVTSVNWGGTYATVLLSRWEDD